MRRALERNLGGLASLLLAVASPVVYFLPNLTGFVLLTTVASFGLGVAAVVRARHGGGSLTLAMAGLVLGGLLTLSWVAWFGALMLNPGAMG